MSRTEKITENIDKLSTKAASGAVKGTVGGVLTPAIDLLKTTKDTVISAIEEEKT